MGKKTRSEQPKGDLVSHKSRLSQADIPRFALSDTLKVAQALADQFGKQPTRPISVADAIDISPGSSNWRYLSGASVAYGLTEGAYNSPTIALTGLGKRIVAPTEEGDDVAAHREAFLRPRIIKEFLEKYHGSRVPDERIAMNVLEDMGVPREATERTLRLILEGARGVGFVKQIKGREWVDLEATKTTGREIASSVNSNQRPEPTETFETAEIEEVIKGPSAVPTSIKENRKVFITHGKNRVVAEQIKELLGFGGFEPVVSVERESVAKPVPDKVLDDMRSCGAAIIHVGSEMKLLDSEGAEHVILNPNVLIEIGAAMALFRRQFILLVQEGVSLPSNLQGLYEVRYTGDKLDYEATMKLLKAFNDFRASGQPTDL